MAQDDDRAAGRGARLAASMAFWQLTPENAWRRNLYVVMLAVFVSFTGFTFVMPFLPLYIKQLGVGDEGDAALWSGFIFGISPTRDETRSTCRSTGMSGIPNENSSTTDAVFTPMPLTPVSQVRASSAVMSPRNSRE